MSEEDGVVATTERKPRRMSLMWVLLTGVLLIGAYAAMMIPASLGSNIPSQAGGSLMFWSAVFFGVLWRHRSRNVWIGLFIGVGVGLLMFVLAVFISGFVRGISGV